MFSEERSKSISASVKSSKLIIFVKMSESYQIMISSYNILNKKVEKLLKKSSFFGIIIFDWPDSPFTALLARKLIHQFIHNYPFKESHQDKPFFISSIFDNVNDIESSPILILYLCLFHRKITIAYAWLIIIRFTRRAFWYFFPSKSIECKHAQILLYKHIHTNK